jgi:hypothetical protein
MGVSSNTLNSIVYVLVSIQVIEFWTEIRHDRCKYLTRKGIRHSEWTMSWPRASARMRDMVAPPYHIAQVSCEPIGNGACIVGKTFPHSELEIN